MTSEKLRTSWVFLISIGLLQIRIIIGQLFNALCISVIKRLAHLFVILLFPIAITFTITIITDSFNMPARSAFWPCGDCRKSCTADSVQCDTCNSWYHYQCQQLDIVDIEYLVTPDATFTRKTCWFAEFGQYNHYFLLSETEQRWFYSIAV